MENRIKNIMSSVFELPADSINADSSPDSIESWDSLRHMNLVLALEEEFEISLKDEEIFEMQDYKKIKFILKNYLK